MMFPYIYAMTGLGIHAISLHISVATQTFFPSDTQRDMFPRFGRFGRCA